MKKKIIIVTLILAVIILASIFSLKMLLYPPFLPESTIEPSADMSLEKLKNPLEDVPYCSQETGFFASMHHVL